MGQIRIPQSVKLIIAFIFKEEGALEEAKAILEKKFGRLDYESKPLDFWYTDYYQKEFGKNLKRKFIGFKDFIPPSDLPRIKVFTNKIEERLSRDGNRRVNIDPGYLDSAKLVLASTKDYKHRIYLDTGIYAEITLFYQDDSFRPWEWSYPDYRSPDYIAIFNQIREIYARQIKGK